MKTREIYRLVRYSPNRPKKWKWTNRNKSFFLNEALVYHFTLEKILICLIKAGVTRINLNTVDKTLAITSDQAPFKYTLPPFKEKKNVPYKKRS